MATTSEVPLPAKPASARWVWGVRAAAIAPLLLLVTGAAWLYLPHGQCSEAPLEPQALAFGSSPLWFPYVYILWRLRRGAPPDRVWYTIENNLLSPCKILPSYFWLMTNQISLPSIRQLDRAGFRTITASNGEQGIAVAKAQMPDLILMDMKMPVMDGVAAQQALKGDPATTNLKVVFLTAFSDPMHPEVDEYLSKTVGAVDFIKKGIGLDELVEKVKGYLGMS